MGCYLIDFGPFIDNDYSLMGRVFSMLLSVTTDMFNYTVKPDFDEKLKLFKAFDFDYIHWCDNWDDDVLYQHDQMEAYAVLLADAGLACLDVHGTATKNITIDTLDPSNLKEYIKLLENRIQFCYTVGGDSLVVHPPKYHAPNLEERLAQSNKVIRAVEDLCIDKSMRLAFENCSRDDHLILKEYFDRYSPEFMGFCFDSGHANIHGNLDQLMGFKDRLIVTHLHDNKGLKDDHQYPGWGNIDWKRVTQWLKECRYRKPWNLEITHNAELNYESMSQYMETASRSAREVLTK